MTPRFAVNRITLAFVLLLLLGAGASSASVLASHKAEASVGVSDPAQVLAQQTAAPQSAPPQRPPAPLRGPVEDPAPFGTFTEEDEYDQYDSRLHDDRGGIPTRQRDSGLADADRLPFFDVGGALAVPNTDDAEDIARDFLASRIENNVSVQSGGADFSLELEHRFNLREGSPTHMVFRETFEGIPVFEGQVQVDVLQDGTVLRADMPGALHTPDVSSDAHISAEDAIRAAANAVIPGRVFTLEETAAASGADRHSKFEGSDGFSEINTSLVYFPSATATQLGWQIYMSPSPDKFYSIIVSADSGELLRSSNLVVSEAPEGNVFAAPNVPNPDVGAPSVEPFTGWPPGVLDCFQVPVNYGGDDCWVADLGPGYTFGNNVVSWADPDGDQFFDAIPSPTGDRHFNFDFTDSYNLTGQLLPDAGAATTNLFYWNNVIHDWLYGLGFTEAAGNFQYDNFGLGGEQEDRVRAFAQVGDVINNAFFGTPPDGLSPQMVMGLFLPGLRRVDTSFAADIIVHEYVHGLTNRMVGGPGNVEALAGPQSAGMGEGWSDLYATSFLDEPTVGQYAVASPTGIRSVRYDDSGHTFGLFGTLRTFPHHVGGISLGHPEVHDDGEIWATVLWDLRQEMIAADPVDGRANFEFLVTQALALTPPNPSMLEARDAVVIAAGIPGILTAGPTPTQCDVFSVFAARGFGASAALNHVQAGLSPEWAISVFEAFDMPPECGGTPIGPGADVFVDGMETGTNGWTADGQWHQSTLLAADGTTSWYFGDEATGTFDSFVPNFGSLTSPVIDLTGVERATIEWDQNLRTQGVLSQFFLPEAGYLLVSQDLGATWQTASVLAHDSSGAKFNHHTVDISRFAGGPIMTMFHFDTGYGNPLSPSPSSPVPIPVPGGWFIDNIRVAALPQLDSDGGPLTPGTPVAGSVDHFDDTDPFSFDGTQGDFVEIAVVATPGSILNPGMAVISPSGTVIGVDNAGNHGNVSSLILPLPETGTYDVIALGRNSMGAYSIEANAVTIVDDDGGPVSAGGNVGGTVDFDGDEDDFTFDGLAGQVAQIDVHRSVGSGLDPVVELIAPDGTVAFNDNNSGPGNSALLVAPLFQDGQYTARVQGNPSTGDYDLSLSFPSVADIGGGPLADGTQVNASIDFSQDTDIWTFDASIWDLVRIIVTPSPGSPIDPRAWLVFPSEEFTFDDDRGPGNGAMIEMQLGETGQFEVVVAAGDNAVGNYDVHVQFVNDVGEGGLIGFDPSAVEVGSGPGNTFLGSIDVPGDGDFVQFSGEAGTPVIIRMQKTENSPVDTAFDLFDPSGNYVDTGSTGSPFWDNSDAVLETVLSETGNYTISPYSQNSGLGGYSVTIAEDAGGGPIVLGQTVHGTVDLGTDDDAWFFSLDATTDVSILLGPPEQGEVSATFHDSGAYIPALFLFSEFEFIDVSVGQFPNDTISLNATLDAGTYVISALAALDNSVGEYQLSLLPTSIAADIEVVKNGGPNPVVGGEDLVYEIVVTNNGPAEATNVQVLDLLPFGTELIGFDPQPPTCDLGPDPATGQATVACQLGNLADGQSATVFIGVAVAENIPDGTVITNYVAAVAEEPDHEPGNNQWWTDTTVISPGYIGPVLIQPVAPRAVIGSLPFDSAVLALDLPLLALDDGDDAAAQGELKQPLQGAQYVIEYDPSLLAPREVIPGYGISDCLPIANAEVPGIIALAFACTSGRSGTPLHMWTVTFDTAPVAQVTRTGLQVSEVFLGDSSVPPRPIEGIGGGEEFDIVPAICGDLNTDGLVNVLDAIIGAKVIVGQVDPTFAQNILGDLNSSGDITVLDLIQMLQFLVGNVDELHCGSNPNDI